MWRVEKVNREREKKKWEFYIFVVSPQLLCGSRG